MRLSIVVASHNEAECLQKTAVSTLRSIEDLDYELIVTDDASDDGSLDALRARLERERATGSVRRWPEIRFVESSERRGPSPTKDDGARAARGDCLLFLDGHTRPARGAIQRLVEDVEELEGEAMVVPRIPHVDPERWTFQPGAANLAFCMELENFDCAWIRRERLERRGRYWVAPAMIGCALAVSRELYEKALGFDRDMSQWGLEDIDLGLKAWRLGHDTLIDARVAIGHRYQTEFTTYRVEEESVLYNKLRMARKNFTPTSFQEWLACARAVEEAPVWEAAWRRFEATRESAEREREQLLALAVRDEIDYAERFGLGWPKRPKTAAR